MSDGLAKVEPPLHRAVEEVSLISVKTGMIALLALLVALQAGFTCGMAQAEVAIEAPCCGIKCPVPCSAGDRACCQIWNSGAPAEAVSAKPSVPALQPLASLIHAYVVMTALNALEQESVFESSPP